MLYCRWSEHQASAAKNKEDSLDPRSAQPPCHYSRRKANPVRPRNSTVHSRRQKTRSLQAGIQSIWSTTLFPLAGFASLIWFVVRVVPKPSRAIYPCQRVAAPLASTFVLWLLATLSSVLAVLRAGAWLLKARPFFAIAFVLVGLASPVWTGTAVDQPVRAQYLPHPANDPIGIAQGLRPGRVAWVHDPDVTDWAGPGSGERWYDHVDQNIADDMLSLALQTYTDANSDAEAWDALIRHFNGGSGFTPGERVAIKINLTTSNARGELADPNYDQREGSGVTLDSIANSPQLMHALLDQLVNVVGVAQSDITIGDPTGLFVNHLYGPLHVDFPGIHYWDNRGTLGRIRAEFGSDPLYWSTPNAEGTTQDYLPLSYEQATYLINVPVLKSHSGAGITVAAKNHYGSLLRCPDGYLRDATNHGSAPYNDYYHMHHSLPGDTFRVTPDVSTMGQYRALTDLMGHEGIGGKTLLYLVDGLFGGKGWNSIPSVWSMSPFDGDWPSSLFISMDAVAIDSVARDFLSEQWPEHVLMYEGVEDYLHEAALAGNPPSGTIYDPEGDGSPLTSLGVHEHWNNADDKQYSRNLDIGDGIELVTPVVSVRRIYLPLCTSGPRPGTE